MQVIDIATDLAQSAVGHGGIAMRGWAAGLVGVSMGWLAALSPAEARTKPRPHAFDGAWHLSFVTRSGACDPSYEFDVNIRRSIISHPNLVRFNGRVSSRGAARASVVVQDKAASGSGRLSANSGRGSWSGYSGGARCAGFWTAQRS